MAASSQGEDEERRALELELAAELAALSAQDVGFDESFAGGDYQQGDIAGWTSSNEELETAYVRLDLEKVLHQVVNISADELQSSVDNDQTTGSNDELKQVELTSWDMLLESVARSDREFFQPCHENLQDIRMSIREVKSSSATLSEQQDHEETGSVEELHALDESGLEFAYSQPAQSVLPPPVEQPSPDTFDERRQECEDIEDEEVTTRNCLVDVFENSLERSFICEPNASAAQLVPPEASNLSTGTLSLPGENRSTDEPGEQPQDDKDLQRELEMIAKQHEARASRRLKTQARYQKERDKAECLLRQLQDELEAQERHAQTTRREALERSLMANEDIYCRKFAAAEREAYESALMILADEASHKFDHELARLQDAISNEVALMAAEEQAECLRMQVERQIRRQQQINQVRCRFSAMLLDLVTHHEVRRQLFDQQTKRERRECVQMRAEEAYSRRVIAETRALLKQQERERTRTLMNYEDQLARAREDFDRHQELQAVERQREEYCGDCMKQEEKRTRSAWTFSKNLQRNEELSRRAMEQEEKCSQCAWMYLAEQTEAAAKERERQREIQRLRVLANISAGFQGLDQVFRKHNLVECLNKWKWWHKQCVEEDQVRSKAVDNAAKRIQMWHRSCRQKLEELLSDEPPLILEDFSDEEEQPQVEDQKDDDDVEELYTSSPINQEAALRLQSTFRGFHVRRKFANALALAEAVGNEEGDSFDAVDLDDLIQLPPELVDGWEDPVLPPVSVLTQQQYPQPPQRIDQEEERLEHVDNNEVEIRSFQSCQSALKVNVPTPLAPGSPPKEQNLAATLWNKMKRVKQRQQHVQQERQRQQDPVYRVQKLLNRKPNARSNQNGNASNQNSHSRLQTPQGGQKAPNMVSWSSTGNAKKKSKVKLPSLVERLRRQTMAER